MRVKATRLGFDGMKRRRPGDVFHVEKKAFSKLWMVECKGPKKGSAEKVEEPKAKGFGDDEESSEGSSEFSDSNLDVI